MKERPILFNAEMVRAILEGRKTQTRRVVKPAPPEDAESIFHANGESMLDNDWKFQKTNIEGVKRDCTLWFKCPYGKPGDRLWVRETFGVVSLRELVSGRLTSETVYRAGPHPFNKDLPHMWTKGVDKWRPSIHMPRWASRINLEITDIRVERVQEISEADCEAEGLRLLQGGIRSEFRVLWDSINDKRGYGWAENPWVWVVEFKVEEVE